MTPNTQTSSEPHRGPHLTCQPVQAVAEQGLELAGLQLHGEETPPAVTTSSTKHTWTQ